MNLQETIVKTIKDTLNGQLNNIIQLVSDVEVAVAKQDARLRKIEEYLGKDLKLSELTVEQAALSESIKGYETAESRIAKAQNALHMTINAKGAPKKK